MAPLFLLMAFCIGLAIPIQSAVNSALRDSLGSGSLLAALVSFSVGTGVLAAACALSGQPFGTLTGLGRLAWWQWLGGFLGAFFVFGSTLLAPRIGLAAMVSIIVAGQLASSLAFDHYGWMGLPLRALTPLRLAGAVLVLAGVLLVNFGDRVLGRPGL